MKQSHIIIVMGVLIAITTTSLAQIPKLTLPPNKGTILKAWTEPANPTSSTAVTLHVSLVGQIQLDRVEMQKTTTGFTVKMYWNDPGNGDTVTAVSAPVYHEESLGVLAPGVYSINVRSFYQERLVDTEHVSFRVSQSPLQGPAKNIENVWIEPEEPTTLDTITLHVSGKWPTPGFLLIGAVTSYRPGAITLNMYWRKYNWPVIQVVMPFDYEAALRNLSVGAYTVRVNSRLDGQLIDWSEISFEVKPADGDLPSDNYGWPWSHWPW